MFGNLSTQFYSTMCDVCACLHIELQYNNYKCEKINSFRALLPVLVSRSEKFNKLLFYIYDKKLRVSNR